MFTADLHNFIRESNRIENLFHDPLDAEVEAHMQILACDGLTLADLYAFVEKCAPGNRLRDMLGLNVRVGNYYPPPGGPLIRGQLTELLRRINDETIDPWKAHCEYEKLHPFTDGNGRSGRAIWLWMMERDDMPIYEGFLKTFYYQTLAHQP